MRRILPLYIPFAPIHFRVTEDNELITEYYVTFAFRTKANLARKESQ